MTTAQLDESVLGWLDGRPLDRTELDRRLAALRGGLRSSALPVPGSAEDRQLTRWVAQVILTEQLCVAEAEARGLDVTDAPLVRLDQLAAVEFGSITAAAFEGCAAVRALYAELTAEVTAPGEQVAAYRAATATRSAGVVWQLSSADGDFEASPDSLPAALAEALRSAVPGETVTVDSWTVVLRGRRELVDPAPDPTDRINDSARRVAFVRWLDHARAHRLRLVSGLEHPGDPNQPDNYHRH